ncbi:MAG: hypothetical protein LBG82_02355 [Clostridiales Family XIII bacterium]|jgi:hypothetical protein|nr:hypothetical protein [Clostridiales Family XIII bacterium]
MRKIRIAVSSKRVAACVVAAALASAVLPAQLPQGAAYAQDPGYPDTFARPYPWSAPAAQTTGDYIADSYSGISAGHVIEPVTQERLLDILNSDGDYYIVFGGPEHETGRYAVPLIGSRAAAAFAGGAGKVYHFDPYIDGYQADITDPSTPFKTTAPITELWNEIRNALPAGAPISTYDSDDTLLLLYSKNGASRQIRASYSLAPSGIAGFSEIAESALIDRVFHGGVDPADAPIVRGSVRTQFEFFKRVYNGASNFSEYAGGTIAPSFSRIGAPTNVIEDADFPDGAGFALKQVTLPELLNVLRSPGEHIIFFGASWCANTEAVIGDVARKAKKFGRGTVYVYDTTLGNQLAFDATDLRKVISTSEKYNSRTSAEVSGANNISYMYAETAKLLGDFKTENHSRQTSYISYYPNGDLSLAPTALPSWWSGSDIGARRLQMPFLLAYDKSKPNPVTRQWLHVNEAGNGTYREYMVQLAWVRGTALAKTVAGNQDGLTNVEYAAEGIAALDDVLNPAAAISGGIAQRSFISAPAPEVSGAAKVGGVLSVSAPAWSPAATKLAYQWYSGGAAVAGATGSTYAVGASDVGSSIHVVVTGARTNYAAVQRASAPTPPVVSDPPAAPAVTNPVPVIPSLSKFAKAPAPKISGTAKVGKTLKASVGKWSPKPTKFTYRWYANGKEIKGAVKASLKLKKAQKGKRITVRVTAIRANYSTIIKTSKATKKVVK